VLAIKPWFYLCLCLIGPSAAASAQSSSLPFLNGILGDEGSQAGKSIERIAGGRVLLPDDPANYAIYALLEGRIRGLDADIRNKADMLSYYRFEDSLLGELLDDVQQIRELIVQESNGLLDDSDRGIIEGEIDQCYDQILSTLDQAEFNRAKVFSSLSQSEAVKAALKTRAHYRLADVDLLLAFFIRERSLVGAKAGGLGYAAVGEAVEAENATGSLSLGDTNIDAEIGSLRREDLLMMVDLLMLGKPKP
jgi:flagellin-like hook-associated protein FlgL